MSIARPHHAAIQAAVTPVPTSAERILIAFLTVSVPQQQLPSESEWGKGWGGRGEGESDALDLSARSVRTIAKRYVIGF